MQVPVPPRTQSILFVAAALCGALFEYAVVQRLWPAAGLLQWVPIVGTLALGAVLLPSKLRGLPLPPRAFKLFHVLFGWSFGAIWLIKLGK